MNEITGRVKLVSGFDLTIRREWTHVVIHIFSEEKLNNKSILKDFKIMTGLFDRLAAVINPEFRAGVKS